MANRSGVTIVGFDSGAAEIALIASGAIRGSITQSPFQIGYVAVESAVKAINGEELGEFIDSGFFWYDATNLDDPDIAPDLYD